MKHKILTVLAAGGGFLALSVTPIWAADADKAADAEVQTDAVNVTTVLIQGGGWGADRRVREALKSQDGIDKFVLSGLRATVIMKDGMTLDKEKLATALKTRRLTLKSMEIETISKPEVAYAVTVIGGTWAVTNDKARVALEELQTISTAYIDNGVTLYLSGTEAPGKDELSKLLAKYGMKVTGMEKTEKLPFWSSFRSFNPFGPVSPAESGPCAF